MTPDPMTHSAPLQMWTIYNRPRDYPDHFVVRRWLVTSQMVPDKTPWAVVSTLEEARNAIPEGLHRLPRLAGDEPQIVETWI